MSNLIIFPKKSSNISLDSVDDLTYAIDYLLDNKSQDLELIENLMKELVERLQLELAEGKNDE